MASFIYNKGKEEFLRGNTALLTDTIKCLLVTSSYTADKDTHGSRSDITNEVSGTGYESGGKQLLNKTITLDNINDKVIFDAADTSWPLVTLTARAAVLYKDTGDSNPSTDLLIAYLDFGTDYSTSGEDFTVEWDAAGILTLGE